jgi:hypothetical protein
MESAADRVNVTSYIILKFIDMAYHRHVIT